jgi:hypothetical protein
VLWLSWARQRASMSPVPICERWPSLLAFRQLCPRVAASRAEFAISAAMRLARSKFGMLRETSKKGPELCS